MLDSSSCSNVHTLETLEKKLAFSENYFWNIGARNYLPRPCLIIIVHKKFAGIAIPWINPKVETLALPKDAKRVGMFILLQVYITRFNVSKCIFNVHPEVTITYRIEENKCS